MDLTAGLVFVLAFLMVFFFLRKKPNLPPGYAALPLIGSFSLMRKLKGRRPHIVLFEEAKTLGRIYRFYIGQTMVVVLSGYDIIHEALVVQKEAFSGRMQFRNNVIQNAFTIEDGDVGILFRKHGSGWRDSRRFTLQALRDFGVGKSSIEDKINEELSAVANYFDSMKDKPTSVRDVMQKVVANVIYSIIFGKRYEYDDPEIDRLGNLTNTVVSGAGPMNPANFLPRFITWFLNRKENEFDVLKTNAIQQMRDYVDNQIEEHEQSFDESNIRDFIDIYIQTSRSDGNELKQYITKANMFRIIFDLFIAGSETTYTALDWAFLCMIEFPEVQKRCREEIDKKLGEKLIEYSDHTKLPYVSAVLMEIQRIGNIVPMNVAHCTTKDTILDGYDIPQNTLVLPMLYSVSMDEKYFPEPTKFNPDRFIDAHGKLIKNDAAIPFSIGPRVCLGEPLARMELFLTLTNLLQKFRFEREDTEIPHTFESRQDLITNSPLPYKIRAIRSM